MNIVNFKNELAKFSRDCERLTRYEHLQEIDLAAAEYISDPSEVNYWCLVLLKIALSKEKTMRDETVECKTKKTAFNRCPWAAVIIKVEGGYRCFESVDQAELFRRQK